MDDQSLFGALSPTLRAGATAQLARERASRLAVLGWLALPMMLLVLRIDLSRLHSGAFEEMRTFPFVVARHVAIMLGAVPAIWLAVRRRDNPAYTNLFLQNTHVALILGGLLVGALLAMGPELGPVVDGRGRVQFTLALIIANLIYQLSARVRYGFNFATMVLSIAVLAGQADAPAAAVSERIIETFVITLILALAGGSMQWQRLRSIIIEQRLEELTLTDGLTGVASRLRVEQELTEAIGRAPSHAPVSLILLDVDRFKSINDNYGHNVGDEVLRLLARLLQDRGRRSDLVGRWGGEEFVIVCEGTKLDEAVTLANLLRARIASHPFPSVGQCTASFGVAESVWGDTVLKLVDRADQALYAAKREGRNRVVEARTPRPSRTGDPYADGNISLTA